MRIAYVTETWPPEFNGVALAAAKAVGDLRRRGHTVELVRPRQCRSDKGGADTLLVPGIAVPLREDVQVGTPVKGKLIARWRQQAPQVVHLATGGPLAWSAGSAARQLGIPVTSEFRSRFVECVASGRAERSKPAAYSLKDCSFWMRSYLRAFHNRSNCTLVPNQRVFEELVRHGFRNLRIGGCDVDAMSFAPHHRSQALRVQWGVGMDDEPVALHVGALASEAQADALAEAYRSMRRERPGTRLVVVGDGPLRAELERRCSDAVFAGEVRGAALARHYASADIFLATGVGGMVSQSVQPAIASGLAVAGYADAALASQVEHDHSALLVELGNVGAFGAAAARLAWDDGLRQRLGENGLSGARQAAWSRLHAEFEEALLATVDGGHEELPVCMGLA